MNYNYQQPYGYNVYPYNQNQQMPMQPNFNQQQMNQNLSNYNNYQQQSTQQQLKCGFVNVSSLDEVKAYIVNANQTVIFNDTNNKILYKKVTDSQGIANITAYQEVNLENKNNNQYVTLEDFNAFKNEIEKRMNGGNNE